jgi:hypothetical protein
MKAIPIKRLFEAIIGPPTPPNDPESTGMFDRVTNQVGAGFG